MTLKETEEAVILPTTLHAHLVEARHLVVHRLPLATSREGGRRSLGDRVENCLDLGDNFVLKRVEESCCGHAALRIVGGMALEEVDQPRFVVHGL